MGEQHRRAGAEDGIEAAWRRVTTSGGASSDGRRLLRRLLHGLCSEDNAGRAREWAREVGIGHGPLEHRSQQLREAGIRSVQDAQWWIARCCDGGEYSAWIGDAEGLTIQGAIEAFWTGSDYPDDIRTVAAQWQQ